jgi:hypothetical protein
MAWMEKLVNCAEVAEVMHIRRIGIEMLPESRVRGRMLIGRDGPSFGVSPGFLGQ